MAHTVHGLHHITAIAGDPQENLDFYVGVLGLRLVKKSVNQDVPDTYHLFYADAAGTPGTDLTFFPWPDMAPARLGTGFATEISFAIPPGSLDYWRKRLADAGADLDETETRFGEPVVPFADPHGLRLALVETAGERPFVAYERSRVPAECQLRGFHSVRLWERTLESTDVLLTKIMGFDRRSVEDGWHRFGLPGGGPGQMVDVRELPGESRGQWGTGGVHHVAWRVEDSDEQMGLRSTLARVGLRPTEQIDRFWFQSVYFREPGGTLFELATDGPGFARDEDASHLGEHLILPPWLEPRRQEIEAGLQPLRMPQR